MARSTEKSRQRARSELRTTQEAVFAKYTKKVPVYDHSLENIKKAALMGMNEYDASFKDGRRHKDLEICLIASCEKHNVDKAFARLLYLAGISWWNDLMDWVGLRGDQC